MAIPTDPRPEFAQGGGASVVEPGAGKKSSGWVAGELPPAETFNWLHRTTYRWLNWLANALTGADGDFQLISTRTLDEQAPFVMSGNPGTKWKKLIEGRAGTNNRWGRIYVGADNQGMILVLNAGWNSSTLLWQLSDSARGAVALRFNGETGVRLVRKASGASPWDDDGWDAAAELTLNGPTTVGSLIATGNVGAATISSSGLATLNSLSVSNIGATMHTATVTNSLTFSETMLWTFSAPRMITNRVDARIGTQHGNITFAADVGTGADYFVGAAGGGGTVDVPLMLRSGATLTQVRLNVYSPAAEFVNFEVWRATQSFTSQTQSKVSTRSGGAQTASGGGSTVTLTYTPDQNATLSGNQLFFARIYAQDNARFYTMLEVTYTTTSPYSMSG